MAILINKTIENFLKKKLYDNDSFAQSILFWGQPYLGKLSTAKFFAKSMLCEKRTWGGCNKCKNCNYYNNDWHPDFLLINNDQNVITKDIVNNFQDFLMLRPLIAHKKILIINQAEKLNYETQSSLLKCLEEPKAHFVIILITNNPHQLLKTVRSRLLPIRFTKPKSKTLIDFLKKEYFLSEENAKNIAELSLFLTQKAIDYINHKDLIQQKKEHEAILKNFNNKNFFEQNLILEKLNKLLETLEKNESQKNIAISEKNNNDSEKPKKILNKYLKILINDWLELIEHEINNNIINQDFSLKESLLKQQTKTFKNTIKLLHYINNYNLNQKLLLDNFCLKTFLKK